MTGEGTCFRGGVISYDWGGAVLGEGPSVMTREGPVLEEGSFIMTQGHLF